MTLAGPLAWSPAPLQLPADLRLTPEQFEQGCAANPEAMLELSADGQLITMPPPAAKPALATPGS
jgi:Uma2 family endonuclease